MTDMQPETETKNPCEAKVLSTGCRRRRSIKCTRNAKPGYKYCGLHINFLKRFNKKVETDGVELKYYYQDSSDVYGLVGFLTGFSVRVHGTICYQFTCMDDSILEIDIESVTNIRKLEFDEWLLYQRSLK